MAINKSNTSQQKLPRLPIPPLESTKSKLIEWIMPLVDNQQFQKSKEVINHFFEENGVAEKLQEKLYEWDQDRDGSWLTPFWDDAYLKHRKSLPTSMNFNVLLNQAESKNSSTIMDTAGKISYLVAELYHEIIDGKLQSSIMKEKSVNLSQFKKIFRSVRVPQLKRDAFNVAPFDKKNNHVALLYKNNVYKVPVTNSDGLLYNSLDITAAIEAAITKETTEGINAGIFTTAERDQAAHVYNELRKSPINVNTLQTIADALVVLSIDEESKNSEEAIKNLMLHATNKYFDKTIQIIITKYGALGFNMEHSAVDGTSVAFVISHVSKGLKQDLPQVDHMSHKPIVEKVKWELSDAIQGKLAQFEKDHLKRKDNYALYPNIFTDFGAEKIKQMKFSPDAFFHMALQIAQYRTYGEFASVYEPVSVRIFHEGRTECARATSMEKRTLVEAIEAGTYSKEQLYDLMQTASEAHSERIRDCQRGLGVERHLFGLEQMYYLFGSELGLEGLPKIYQDEGYTTLRHDVLSTSGMAYENAQYRMFAPVAEDGHGVAYFLLDHSISINISSFAEKKHKGNQLMNHMVDALHELKKIAEEIEEKS